MCGGASRYTNGSFGITPDRKKPVIGLVGGIGAGKSTVAEIFESLGAAVIDADRLAHEQLRVPRVVAELRSWLGDSILRNDGTIDRSAVADIVFSDTKKLAKLESLLYPRIEKRRQSIMSALETDSKIKAFVLDAPKLIEAGLGKICACIVFVDADRSVRLERMIRSRGWLEEELNRREKNLSPLDRKRALSDYVIVNNSGKDALRPQLERVFSSILASLA